MSDDYFVPLGVVFLLLFFLGSIMGLSYMEGVDVRHKILECHKVNQHRPAVDTKLLCNPK